MRPLRGLQETRVATREESGVLGFPSRREHSVGRAQETDTWSRLGPGSQNCQEGGQRTGEGCRPRWGEGVVEDSQGAPHPEVV